ncbi:MAG TPA: DUF86 domain-containing protein [Stellaceae bacterium]
MTSDLPFLGHIADSIAAIESYTANGRDTFLADRLIQDAVIRNFEIIGEAAGRLSASARGSPGAPWRKIIAFRNRLIHAYWSIDLLLVWDVIENDLPSLKGEVSRLRTQLSGGGSQLQP